MVNVINTAVIGITVVVLGLSTTLYLFQGEANAEVRIAGVQHGLAPTDDGQAQLQTVIQLENPHAVEVTVTRIDYTILVNGARISQGALEQPFAIPAGAEGAATIVSTLPEDFPSGWWHLHVQRGEQTEVVLSGTLTARAAMQDVSLPFEHREALSTDLLALLASPVSACPPGAQTLCLRDLKASWLEGRPSEGVEMRFTVENPRPVTVRLDHAEVRMLWHGVPVAAGSLAVDVSLPSEQAQDLGVPLTFRGDGLEAWWLRHLSSCSSTPVQLEVNLTVQDVPEEDDVEAPEDEEDLQEQEPSPPVRTLAWGSPVRQLSTGLLCDSPA